MHMYISTSINKHATAMFNHDMYYIQHIFIYKAVFSNHLHWIRIQHFMCWKILHLALYCALRSRYTMELMMRDEFIFDISVIKTEYKAKMKTISIQTFRTERAAP